MIVIPKPMSIFIVLFAMLASCEASQFHNNQKSETATDDESKSSGEASADDQDRKQDPDKKQKSDTTETETTESGQTDSDICTRVESVQESYNNFDRSLVDQLLAGTARKSRTTWKGFDSPQPAGSSARGLRIGDFNAARTACISVGLRLADAGEVLTFADEFKSEINQSAPAGSIVVWSQNAGTHALVDLVYKTTIQSCYKGFILCL